MSISSAIITSIIIYIIVAAAEWKIFEKAGQAGWKAIIPIYNGYISYKIAWKTTVFWITMILSIAGSFLLQFVDNNMALAVIGCILSIASGGISIVYMYKLSKAYGHGIGFAIGLIFLNPIFLLILGYGKSEYVNNNQE